MRTRKIPEPLPVERKKEIIEQKPVTIIKSTTKLVTGESDMITVYARNASEVKAFVEMNYPEKEILSIQFIPSSVTQKHLEYAVRLKK